MLANNSRGTATSAKGVFASGVELDVVGRIEADGLRGHKSDRLSFVLAADLWLGR